MESVVYYSARYAANSLLRERLIYQCMFTTYLYTSVWFVYFVRIIGDGGDRVCCSLPTVLESVLALSADHQLSHR